MRKRFLSFVLIFFIAFSSLNYNFKYVSAEPVSTMQLVGFILSVTGAVNMVSGGGVTKISGTIRDTLAQKCSDLMGTGIYTDSEGNYVFSSDATKQIYDVLYNSSSMDVRVISSFYGLTPMAGLAYYGNPDFPITLKNYVDNSRTLFSSYLIGASVDNYRTSNSSSPDYVKYGTVNIYDISNVAYFLCQNGQLLFYNSSGNKINVSFRSVRMKSDNTGISYSQSGTVNQTNNRYNTGELYTDYANFVNVKAFYLLHDLDDTGIGTTDFTFSQFPFFNHEIDGSVFWSNRSLLIGKNINELYSHYNNPGGIVCANDYTNLPSVSSTVINNNNWDSIYNNYVSNVSNNLQYFYNSETNTYNYDEMYKFLKTFNNNITNEVESNNTDIEQSINYNNNWLSLIYERLGNINIKLDNISSGGGNDVWTQQDISDIKASLNRLENSLTQEYSQLEAIYTYLAVLNTSIQAISSSNNPNNIYNDYSDYYDILVNLPVSDVTDIIDKGDTVKELIPTVAPFSYLNLAGGILSDLTVDPVEPSFAIPLTFSHDVMGQTFDVDETLDLDLSVFNDIRLMVNGFFVILFIFGLCWISVFVIKMFLDLLDWG